MKSAIEANRSADWDRAAVAAKTAETLYAHSGNVPGAARSQLEAIYAYRRHSRAAKCINEIHTLNQRLQKRTYASFQLLADFEGSVCQSMLGDFDLGWRLAQRTISEAHAARYLTLELRVLSLLSAMDSAEGRFSGAFQVDAEGLELFWQGLYAPERGFQFYSDAALTAEQAGFWHLAVVLQGEALSMLAETDRSDFQALAHHHLGTSAYRAGDTSETHKQFTEVSALLSKIPAGSSREFIQASSEIELASLEIAGNNLKSAQARLEKAALAIEDVDSFVVKLSYLNAWASLERRRNRPAEEWKYLEKTTEVARKGFVSLGSLDNRWEWYLEVDQAYHRLVELELDLKHDPVQALADWEDYRAAEIAPAILEPLSKRSRVRLLSHLEKMPDTTFISFIVFSDKVNIWVADSAGIRPFSVKVDSEALKREVEGFLRLCSDRDSSLEKVSQAGSRLYERLFKPIEGEIKPDRYLAVEADGFLSRIPWAALVMGNGEYLGQQYMTVGTPGLYFNRAKPPAAHAMGNTLVAYPGAVEYEGKQFPPLPHAREEADFVAKLHPGTIYLREEQATANQLLRQLSRASLFHFAGHAVSREHGGELLLAGNEVVSSSAIRRLDLRRMQLVVLSACSTADADLDIARSPNGLVQAFLASGAQGIVASRWDVDSQETYEFAKQLHSSVRSGRSSPLAMRDAREHVHGKRTHPYYWSSFELFGFSSARAVTEHNNDLMPLKDKN